MTTSAFRLVTFKPRFYYATLRSRLEPYICDQELWPVVCPVNTPPSSAVAAPLARLLLFLGYTSALEPFLTARVSLGWREQTGRMSERWDAPQRAAPPAETRPVHSAKVRDTAVSRAPAHVCNIYHRRRSTCMLRAMDVKEVMGHDATSLMLLLLLLLFQENWKTSDMFFGSAHFKIQWRRSCQSFSRRQTDKWADRKSSQSYSLSEWPTSGLTDSQSRNQSDKSKQADWLTKGQQKEKKKSCGQTERNECCERRPGRANSRRGDTAGWWPGGGGIEGKRWGVKRAGYNTEGCWGGETRGLNCWCKRGHTPFFFLPRTHTHYRTHSADKLFLPAGSHSGFRGSNENE